MAFEAIGGECVFSSEIDKYARKTYRANFIDPPTHVFNYDIRLITRPDGIAADSDRLYDYINEQIPDHDVLLAGFPCQPFSSAGVSARNYNGQPHGFACQTKGTLFFDIAMIIKAKRPAIFVLENVKNLKGHDAGRTYKLIAETIDDLGYHLADKEYSGKKDPKIIDAAHFLPQHRERIVLVGFRKDLNLHNNFTLKDIYNFYPENRPKLSELLETSVDNKYTLSEKLWKSLQNHADRHKDSKHGFGYSLVNPENPDAVTRTLSARYYKDGSEILLTQHEGGKEKKLPRRLTPLECSRLMGFNSPSGSDFKIPVSDTQAYRQFGNAVVVPVFKAIASMLQSRIHRTQSGDPEIPERALLFGRKALTPQE